jgi:chemotaxis protein MotB
VSEEVFQKDEIVEEGAPSWMVTFGDLMSLLLCFFVLLLSFSEMDRKKYKIVSGSMKNAFGMQKKTPVFDSPKGNKIIARNFDQAIIVTRMEEKIAKPIVVEVNNNFKEWEDLVQVEVEDNKVTIRLLGETTFDTGRSEIRQKMKPLLLKIGSILNEIKGDIVVAGHTDNVPLSGGRFNSNLGLSLARSATVAEFLMQQTGIVPDRISTMGYGDNHPIATNSTAEGRQKNRRVEIIVMTK